MAFVVLLIPCSAQNILCNPALHSPLMWKHHWRCSIKSFISSHTAPALTHILLVKLSLRGMIIPSQRSPQGLVYGDTGEKVTNAKSWENNLFL